MNRILSESARLSRWLVERVRRVEWRGITFWLGVALRMCVTAMLVAFVVMFAAPIAELFEGAWQAYRDRPEVVIATVAVIVGCVSLIRAPFRARRRQRWMVSHSVAAPALGAAVLRMRHHSSERAHGVARHEAAHAIVAAEVGREGISADIWIRGDSDGQTAHSPRAGGTLADRTFDEMMVTYAGQVIDAADGRHDGGSLSDMRKLVDQSLLILAAGEKPARYDGPLTVDALMQGARAAAAWILEERASAVDQVAAHIAENNSIDDAAVRACLYAAAHS